MFKFVLPRGTVLVTQTTLGAAQPLVLNADVEVLSPLPPTMFMGVSDQPDPAATTNNPIAWDGETFNASNRVDVTHGYDAGMGVKAVSDAADAGDEIAQGLMAEFAEVDKILSARDALAGAVASANVAATGEGA